MSTAPRLRARLWTGAALVPASVVAVLAFWSLSGPAGPGSTLPARQASATVSSAPGHAAAPAGHVVLRAPNGLATATLDGTPAARAFAAMLPLRLTLHDPMGQAKSGELPSPIDVADEALVFDPRVGELYYWAPSHTVAIFYDDLGQSIPPPGLVRLGVVDGGLASIITSGNGFAVQVEIADGTVARTES
jgi:hypothetical protein